jgi:hypothetical protein
MYPLSSSTHVAALLHRTALRTETGKGNRKSKGIVAAAGLPITGCPPRRCTDTEDARREPVAPLRFQNSSFLKICRRWMDSGPDTPLTPGSPEKWPRVGGQQAGHGSFRPLPALGIPDYLAAGAVQCSAGHGVSRCGSDTTRSPERDSHNHMRLLCTVRVRTSTDRTHIAVCFLLVYLTHG